MMLCFYDGGLQASEKLEDGAGPVSPKTASESGEPALDLLGQSFQFGAQPAKTAAHLQDFLVACFFVS